MKTLNIACAAIGAAGLCIVAVAACTPDQPAVPQPVVIEQPTVAPVAETPTSDWQASLMAALETPCEQEDSANCYWRADIMGNGTGTSFVNVEGNIFPLTSVLEG